MGETSEADFFAGARVAILGLGLMGGSLALALRGQCSELLGYDPHPPTLALARQRGVVDRLSDDPRQILPEADIVVLAAPVRAILAWLDELPSLLPGETVVLDLGSTKKQIAAAMERLPERFDPLGGHPMCGKESSSLENAEASLFQGAAFAFTPLSRTSPLALAVAETIARGVGAVPVWLDPDTHDRWAAATSHLPYLISNLLAYATPGEAAPLVGPGFRSATRLAVTPTRMMQDILMTNRENILCGLKQFRQQVETLERLLSEGDESALVERLERGADRQRTLTSGSRAGGDRT
jgi:prephenate dehydrogenase